MLTPIVTDITRRPEPVAHDTFIDDLRGVRGSDPGAQPHKEPPR